MVTKHQHNFEQLIFVLFAMLLAFMTGTAEAEIVARYGGYYTSTTTTHLLLPPYRDDGRSRLWPYDYERAISPEGEYLTTDNNTAVGPLIFGALQNIDGATGPSHFLRYRLTTSGEITTLQIWGNDYVSALNRIVGLIFFKIDATPARTVKLRASDTLSITSGFSSTPTLRMAVMSEGVWYLSQSYFSSSKVIEDLNEMMWAIWGPTGDDLIATGLSYDHPGRSLANIEAVGFHFNIYRSATGARPQLNLTRFEANLTVIPQGTTALVR